jgi:2-phosphoglycerate kinase
VTPAVVVLVCGASGVGKSHAASALAARYGVPLGEADDIVTALTAMTTVEHQPALHYWATRPTHEFLTPQRIADLHFDVAVALRPAFEAVIADHIEFGAPVVMEGDYLTPDLALSRAGRVVAVVLDEPDEDQLVANYAAREGGEHRSRAKVSVLVGSRLASIGRRVGAPVVAARPWRDQVDRIDAALRAAASQLRDNLRE